MSSPVNIPATIIISHYYFAPLVELSDLVRVSDLQRKTNESVPIQLAQFWFRGLAISDTKI